MLMSYFLSIIISCVALGWAGMIAVIKLIDPYESSLGKVLLLASVFIAVTSTLTIIGYGMRRLFNRGLPIEINIKISFRQGFLFGLAVVLGLFLQSQRLLTAGNAFLLIALLATIEYFFLSLRQTTSS